MSTRARSQLIEQAAAVVSELSEGQARTLAAEIEALTEPRHIDLVAGRPAPPGVKRLSATWVETAALDSSTLAVAIRCAARAARTVSSYEKVELLYTGPGSGTIRRNEYGLLDVIRSAKHDLWVVSYLFIGLEDVVRAISERNEAGVEVRVLLDHEKTREFARATSLLSERGLGDSIWIWDDEHRVLDRGRVRALHAKCAVADGHMAFISSANLTEKAMDENLEVGVLVAGGAVPKTLSDNFEELASEGVLVRSLAART